jgi:hypothetical protein
MTWPIVLKVLPISEDFLWNTKDTLKVWGKYSAGYALHFLGINAFDAWNRIEQFAATPGSIGARGRGFRAMDDQLHQLWLQEQIYTFHKDTEEYDKLVQREYDATHFRCSRPMDEHLKLYEELMRLSEDYGVYPIFFTTPPHWGGGVFCFLSSLPPEHRLASIFMKDHPEVFKRENFVNYGHMTNRGARAYTLLFAKSLADLFRQIR